MGEVWEYFTEPKFYETIVVLVVLILILTFIKKFLIKKVAYTTKGEQHTNTFIGVVFSLLQYFVAIFAVFIILKINGVDVTGILAGLGIFATIVGLALQDTLKDLIAGISIFNNNFYKVGDIVMYNGEQCEVKFFNARVTKFKSLATGSTYTVCNSSVKSIEKIKDSNIVFAILANDVDPKVVEKMFKKIAEEIDDLKGPSDAQYIGACGFDKFGIKFGIVYKSSPRYAGSAKTLFYNRVYEECHKLGIKIFG